MFTFTTLLLLVGATAMATLACLPVIKWLMLTFDANEVQIHNRQVTIWFLLASTLTYATAFLLLS